MAFARLPAAQFTFSDGLYNRAKILRMKNQSNASVLIDEYLEKLGDDERNELLRIRRLVKQIVPEAEEAISYSMPAFKFKGKYLIAYAAFKDHLSLFPTPGPIEELKDKLGNFKLAKGTIQFTPSSPIPEALIREILSSRLKSF